jgi:hypothetical protein
MRGMIETRDIRGTKCCTVASMDAFRLGMELEIQYIWSQETDNVQCTMNDENPSEFLLTDESMARLKPDALMRSWASAERLSLSRGCNGLSKLHVRLSCCLSILFLA